MDMVFIILVPVVAFVAVAVLGRLLYTRLAMRSAEAHRVTHSRPGQRLDDLEKLVRRYYKAQGYEVLADSDPEAGLIVIKDEQRTVVRCLGGSEPLGVDMIEQAVQIREQHHAQRIVLISPQGYSEDALQRAPALGVELRSQDHINVMLNLMRRREVS